MKINKPKSFTIKRKLWQRGTDGDNTFLQGRATGRRCCIGFFALACGAVRKDIINMQTPRDLALKREIELPGLITRNGNHTMVANELFNANDRKGTPSVEREQRIKKLFKTINVAVKFVD